MSAKRPGRQARHTALLVAAAFAAALLLVETRMRASSAGAQGGPCGKSALRHPPSAPYAWNDPRYQARVSPAAAGVFADAGWQEFEQEPHPEPGQLEQGLAQGESSVLAAAAAAAAAATAAQRAAAARSRASGAAAPAIRTSCSRLLWMTGLQVRRAGAPALACVASLAGCLACCVQQPLRVLPPYCPP